MPTDLFQLSPDNSTQLTPVSEPEDHDHEHDGNKISPAPVPANRKRLNITESMRKVEPVEGIPPPFIQRRRPVARVLFGVPKLEGITKAREAFKKLVEERQNEFRKKWNFDPVLDIPIPLSTPVKDEDGNERIPGCGLVWTRLYDYPSNRCYGGESTAAKIGITRRERSPSPEIDRKKLIVSPNMKQSSITDYMKVKKTSPNSPIRPAEKHH